MGTEATQHRETARALEVILSRLRLDSATAHILKGHLGYAREAVERAEAEAQRLRDEGPWPNGCTKRRSCARNKACMYGWNGSCRHEGRNIVAEIEAFA